MPGRLSRNLIRFLVGAALCAALVAAVAVPMPAKLPAVAMGQPGLYRMEVALLIFYCWLLLATPAFSGLIQGRLPIEISTRGARFAEEADQMAALNKGKIEELERTTDVLAEGLAAVNVDIERLKSARGDSSQPEVDSKL
jgi:hypothetical protein